MQTTKTYDKIDTILSSYQSDSKYLIAIMQDIQKEYRYLPEDILEYIAEKLEISIAKVYGVATFYENFSLEPKGRYVIRVCDGTACHVRKSQGILKALREELKLPEKQSTTSDMLFTVETVACLGACGLAPVCTVNDDVYPAMTPEAAKSLIQKLKEESADEVK